MTGRIRRLLSAAFAPALVLAALTAVVAGPERSPAPAGPFGWRSNPAAVAEVRGLLGDQADFAMAGKECLGRAVGADEADVYLGDQARQVLGDLIPPRDQGSVGSCVSFGTVNAVEHLECVQIATWPRTVRGPPPGFKELAQEVVYGGSRVQVGKGRIRGDGSVGAWAAQWCKDYGVVARAKYDWADLTAYSADGCRKMGSAGVPAAGQALAKEHPVKQYAQVKTFEELCAAIRNGYPVACCSGQGFSRERDQDGFCRPQGSWGHCLAVVGVQTSGQRQGAFVLNSWGTRYHTGPSGKFNPSPAGFWADKRVVERMLAAGDSWAFSDLTGFPARKLRWRP